MSCRARLSYEDRCGEPAVATDRDTEEERCAEHVREQDALLGYDAPNPSPIHFDVVGWTVGELAEGWGK